jgi:predicted ATPase
MLTSLHLENFRAFGAATTIPLAPITLLFGENSSGKTSVLHALTLLKQTQDAEHKGAALVPRGLVDLGSFEEFVFDHDTTRELSIGIAFEREEAFSGRIRSRRLAKTGGSSALSWSFRHDRATGDVQLARVVLRRPDSMDEYARYEHDPERQSSTNRLSRKVVWNAKLSRLKEDESELALAASAIDGAAPALILALEKAMENVQRVGERMPEARGYSHWRDRRLKACEGLRAKLMSGSSAKWLRSVVHSSWEEVEWIRYALQLEVLPSPRDKAIEPPMETLTSYMDSKARAQFDKCLYLQGAVALAEASIQGLTTLDRLVPIGPFRKPAARVYSFSGTAPGTVGSGGELVPELLHRDETALENVNDWFRHFEIRYELRLEQLGGKTRSDIFELRLLDLARAGRVEVAFNDVGFGISQMLPIIVQSVASRDRIITIEQPEVHIHPRLQAEIGDLLVETMQKNGHQFLVETHSEHLILRLRRLVREGKLKPSDLCVLHVSRGREGAEVQRIHVGEDGSFLDEWPGGFFPERLRELT